MALAAVVRRNIPLANMYSIVAPLAEYKDQGFPILITPQQLKTSLPLQGLFNSSEGVDSGWVA